MADRKMQFSFVGKDVSASKAMENVGKSAHGLGHSLASVGKIAAGVFGGNLLSSGLSKVESFAKGSIGYFNNTAKASLALQHTTGGTVKSASELIAIGQKYGLTSSQVTLATKTMEKGSVTGTKAWEAYGIKAGSTTSMLKQVANQFAKMPDGPKKAAEAQTMFGRSGITMIPILDKGAKGLAALRKQADATGNTIGGKAAKNFVAFRETQRKLSETTDGLKMKLGEALEPALTKVMKAVVKLMPGIEGGAKKYLPELEKAASKAADTFGKFVPVLIDLARSALPDLKTGLSGAASILGKTAGWIQKNNAWLKPLVVTIGAMVVAWEAFTKVMAIVTAVTKVYAGVQAMLDTEMDANPIGLIVIALAGLAVGLVEAYKHSQKFRDVVQGALHVVEGSFKDLLKAGDTVWHGIDAAFNGVKTAVSKVKAVTGDVISFVKAHWPLLAGILAGPFGLAVGEIIQHWGKVKSFFKAIPGDIKGFFSGAAKMLLGIGSSIIDGLVHGIESAASNLIPGALKKVTDLIPGSVKKFLGIFSPSRVMIPLGASVIDGLVKGIVGDKAKIVAAVKTIVGTLNTEMSKGMAAASAKLQAAKSNASSIASGISGNFNVSNSFDSTTGKFAGVASFAAAQQKAASQVRREAGLVKKALKAGLNMTDINQIMQLAPAQADAALSSILGTAGSVKSLNSSAHEMNRFAKQTGNEAAGVKQAHEDAEHLKKLLEQLVKTVSQDHLSAAIAILASAGASSGMSPTEVRMLKKKLERLERTLGHKKAA